MMLSSLRLLEVRVFTCTSVGDPSLVIGSKQCMNIPSTSAKVGCGDRWGEKEHEISEKDCPSSERRGYLISRHSSVGMYADKTMII